MMTNRIPNGARPQRHGQDDEDSRCSSPDRHPHQIAASSLGRTDTSELSAITLSSAVSQSDLSPTAGVGENGVGGDGSPFPPAPPLHQKLHGQALHDEAMATARQERSVASLPSLATAPERVNDEGQSLLHRGRITGQTQDKLYRSFGTMEEVSGASGFAVDAAADGSQQSKTAKQKGQVILPSGDDDPGTPVGFTVPDTDDSSPHRIYNTKKTVGFSEDMPMARDKAEAHREKAKGRKSVRFSVINMFANALGMDPSSDDNDDEENNVERTVDKNLKEGGEVGRKRGWSIIRNRRQSIVLYGRRLIQQDDEEEGRSNGGGEESSIFLSERSAQRRESDRRARQREKILQRANLAASRYEFTIADCLVAIACYLGLSALAFSLIFEHWTIIDSAYFAVVTFTACGYGDLVPSTSGGRIFGTFFAIGGCAFLGIALGILGDHMVRSEVEKRKKLELQRQTKVMKSFVAQESSGGSERNLNMLRDSLGSATARFSRIKIPAIIFIATCSTFISIREGWDFVDGLFYTIVTACTIGYGDLAPTLESTRAVAIIFVPFSVACLGALLARVASAVINIRQQKFRNDLLQFELTPDLLEACDVSNDGRVDKGEYMTFMLLAMKAVDAELLDAISAQFHKLDATNSGDLCIDDLLEALEKNLKSPKKKLELHRYKQSLLSKGARRNGLSKSTRFGSGHIGPIK
jgi:hypothetical protein